MNATTTLSDVEATLTQENANKVSDESYLGEASEAEIFNVRTDEEIESEEAFIEFDIWLPNSKRGCISFSKYEFRSGRVESFLENINCTVNDLKNVYTSIPVTFTTHKGWIAVYGNEKHLESTYSGTSQWYTIDSDSGSPFPTSRHMHLLNLPFYIGLLFALYTWSIFPAVFGFAGLVAFWYGNCMAVGMSSPRRKSISVTEE